MKRWIYFLISSLLTTTLIILLNKRIGKIPALGNFMSPQHGFWQNAEPFNYNFNELHLFKDLKGEVEVVFDERLVPHVYAENQEDAVFVQGYLHARFRLWQMEFQTHAAAGRVSEILGDVALEYDREQRRIGMVYGAEVLLKELESDPLTKSLCDAYTAGVNAYIKRLPASQVPIEYKLLGYHPEPWSNLKIALFVKAMSKRLSGYSQDLEFSAVRHLFTDAQMKILFPSAPDSLQPIIPKGTIFPPASVVPVMPATADSLYFHSKSIPMIQDIDPSNPQDGSNNWVVSGSKTKNGAPILCNDPHLELSLPAIWFEMQMSGPNINVYGSSFPGIPGIVIGFNDHIAWGITNSERDMRDYYEIRFKDDSKKEYWFSGQWQNTKLRVEKIKVKDEYVYQDTVAYTVFGPVVYDRSFKSNLHPGRAIAMRWKALDPSNEAKAFWLLNHAQNYNDFVNAIQYVKCPPQNFIFASKTGDIAIWQQGEMPARWNRQGLYIMPGSDSSYMWQGFIPQQENPHAFNPEQGFLQSANQRAVDSTYPYFIPGSYDFYRAFTIQKFLEGRQNITVDEMKKLQNENYNSFAATLLPVLFRHLQRNQLDPAAQRYYWQLKSWNLKNDVHEKGPVLFNTWFDYLEQDIWADELAEMRKIGLRPPKYVLTEALLRDTAFAYVDNIQTTQKETLSEIVTQSFIQMIPKIDSLSKVGKLEWGAYKNTTVYHILKNALLPFARTGLPIGGGEHVINATQHSHGASWRMVIELGAETEAFVVYPGGQSGNPGSRYYDPFVNTWAEGKYYRAWVYKHSDGDHPNLRWRMRFASKKESLITP